MGGQVQRRQQRHADFINRAGNVSAVQAVNEGASHIRPCLNILEGQGAQAIEWHSGGGFMHAIGVIERDGLRVLFWTGIDAVGANSPAGDWTSPEDGLQAMGLEDDEAPSLLVEISS